MKLENAGTEFRGFARESGYEKSNPCSETKGVNFFKKGMKLHKHPPFWLGLFIVIFLLLLWAKRSKEPSCLKVGFGNQKKRLIKYLKPKLVFPLKINNNK